MGVMMLLRAWSREIPHFSSIYIPFSVFGQLFLFFDFFCLWFCKFLFYYHENYPLEVIKVFSSGISPQFLNVFVSSKCYLLHTQKDTRFSVSAVVFFFYFSCWMLTIWKWKLRFLQYVYVNSRKWTQRYKKIQLFWVSYRRWVRSLFLQKQIKTNIRL